MSQHYCHQCSVSIGLKLPSEPDTLNLTGTAYQLEKYIKHTSPTGTYQVNSIFDEPNFDSYRNYIITGTISGMLEIDDRGRKNLIWYAGEQTGVEYRNGAFIAPANGIKIVLPEDSQCIHAFPIQGCSGTVYNCLICGSPLPQW
jgi:hypothetical protein